jgi:hypothetical protein
MNPPDRRMNSVVVARVCAAGLQVFVKLSGRVMDGFRRSIYPRFLICEPCRASMRP